MLRAVGVDVAERKDGGFDATVEYRDVNNKDAVVEVRVHTFTDLEGLNAVIRATLSTLAPALRLESLKKAILGVELGRESMGLEAEASQVQRQVP